MSSLPRDLVRNSCLAGSAWGTVRLSNQHLFPEYVLDLEVAALQFWFESGSDEIFAGWEREPPIRLLLEQDAWNARLVGFADEREVPPGGLGGEIHPTFALARSRTNRLLDEIIGAACPPEERAKSEDCERRVRERVFEVQRGALGESPFAERNYVSLELYRRQASWAALHEIGHMLGLGDEYRDGSHCTGTEPASSRYSALVAILHRDEVVTRQDDESIMSRGVTVQPRHYVTVLGALKSLTGDKGWEIESR